MIRSTDKTCTSSLSRGIAFVFDLDGVIVDSNRVHSDCWTEYLFRHGLAKPAGFDRNMFGRHNSEIVRWVFGPDLAAAEVSRHGAEKERLYREMMGPVLDRHLVPGVREFLGRHAGMPMAVATNGEPANAEFILDRGGLRGFFRVLIDGAQISRPKPDPESYLEAAARLGVPPVNCIVFEDSIAGVVAARAAGTRVVAVETTHSESELAPVELSIKDFRDPALEPWLSTQKPVE